MHKEDEQKWVQEAPDNPQALMRLYEHYFPRVLAYVSYRIHTPQDAEDIVAEIFLKVVRDIHRFEWRHDYAFSGWLFQIAYNQVMDFYRQQAVETRVTTALTGVETTSVSLEEAVLHQETFQQARTLIQRLPPRQQEVITLKFFGHLRNQEIAAILKLNEKTVAAHLCRGLQDLYRAFAPEAPPENAHERHVP